MGRPADWTPLGCASDPVPGDPDEISRQAAHLASVARQITSQVAALRAIAADADGSLTGAYATKIDTAASDTSGQLAQVAGRYEKASAALRAWVPDLEYAQALSLRALNQAEAPYLALKNLVPPTSPAGGPLTTAQEQDQQAYHRITGRAQVALDAARALLAKAVSARDEAADGARRRSGRPATTRSPITGSSAGPHPSRGRPAPCWNRPPPAARVPWLRCWPSSAAAAVPAWRKPSPPGGSC